VKGTYGSRGIAREASDWPPWMERWVEKQIFVNEKI